MSAAASVAAVLGAGAFLAAPAAHAAFGLSEFDVTYTDQAGFTDHQAGSHPFAMTTNLHFISTTTPGGGEQTEQAAKDLLVAQMPGFVGDPYAVTRCTNEQFLTNTQNIVGALEPGCQDSSAVGYIATTLASQTGSGPLYAPVYNLVPPPGKAAKLGFVISTVRVTIELGTTESAPYNVFGGPTNISQLLEFTGSELTLWGVPGDSAHDPLRGRCLDTNASGNAGQGAVSAGECAGGTPRPFLTLPRACEGPLRTEYETDSWQNPGAFVSSFAETHNGAGDPEGMKGCGKLGFEPAIAAKPTSAAAGSPSGLDFSLDTDNDGLANPSYEAVSNADLEKAVVTLPEGFTANPALAEGLATCSEAQFEAETPYLTPGEGPTYTPPAERCPEASKLGTVEVETPILESTVLRGSLYVATPYENPSGSLLGLYMVIREPKLGLVIRQPMRVVPDPQTGRLTTIAEDLPPYPISHFALHFRQGTRSPLATPPLCGTYDGHDAAHEPVRAELFPSSGAGPAQVSSAFEIVSGPNGGPCPSGGLPPFHPELLAGTINNAAGSFSSFNVKITRSDSEQEITHFSIKLPPGVAGKLAGIPFCTDAEIAQAVSRTGPHGGREELESPSCPAASQVGRTLAGAGVGPSLAYAPGKIYLAGPYKGAPVSLVSITSGVVGPFDIGTVVVRLAVKVNPETGEVFLDSTGSDPIPHIIKGIPVHLRDIRAYTDRPEFTFNPTSCEPTSTSATVLGSGLDFVSEADDNPFVSTSRFQAADCAALPFKPKLTLTLKGSTKRGGDPALHAHLAMNGFGEAGLAFAQVALPPTEFLDNAHVGNICTRAIFREGAIEGEKFPANSVIGHAKAVTPILEAPLEGPIYLRSNPERNLPDIAAALRGQEISVTAVGHTDSAPGGGLRNTFEVIPDAPVSSVDIDLFGGNKGLLKNAPKRLSNTVCGSKTYATVKFKGHNGKQANSRQALKVPGCGNHKKRKPRRRH